MQRNEPAAINVLADELELDRTTLARNLRPLERDGLLSTTAPPADQRVTEVRLTARGRRVIEKALPSWRKAQASVAARLGAKRVALLRELAAEWSPALRASSQDDSN